MTSGRSLLFCLPMVAASVEACGWCEGRFRLLTVVEERERETETEERLLVI